MAALADADRREAWAEFMRGESNERNGMALAKVDLRAAFDALDSWVDSQALVINVAIPQPARGALTARQKAKILSMVLAKRYGTGV